MVRIIIQVSLLLFVFSSLMAQSPAPAIASLSDRYPAFQEKAITTKRYGIDELIPLFDRHNQSPDMSFDVKANSLEGRPVYLARYGNGKIPVLFWSQMHGDESTATMALLDLFNYFSSNDEADRSFLKMIRDHLSLYFIPMLNPDGAAQFKRRNAAHIDLNRDAIHLANPESKLLKKVRDSLRPAFGFNLHDQSIYYRAGRDGQQVALAFLAPAFDYEKNINGVRMKSMQLISILNDSLQLLIPGRIGVYDDSFEPRAFGDNIQRWGTSTILIESGGYPNDPEKQYLRKLNFLTLIKALESISTRSYETKTIREYQAIPQNDRKMMSLIIRELNTSVEGHHIQMDMGYQYEERNTKGKIHYPASINDVGDLSVYTGFEEFQAGGYSAFPGRWYAHSFKNVDELLKADWTGLIREGYLGFIVKEKTKNVNDYPFHIAMEIPPRRTDPLQLILAPGRNPTFILKKGSDRFVVHNGSIYTVEEFIGKVGK